MDKWKKGGMTLVKDPRKNAEGYADPTAYYGMKDVIRQETEVENRATELIRVLKFIIRACGFELTARIRIKDIKTGKEFR